MLESTKQALNGHTGFIWEPKAANQIFFRRTIVPGPPNKLEIR